MNAVWYFFRLKHLLFKIKPDVFHAHYVGLNGLLGALCRTHPFILTAWGSDVLIAGKHPWKRILVSYALHNADLITCDAEHMKQAILSFGIRESMIHIIQFGIDTKTFSPGACLGEICEKLDIPIGLQVVISMRNFDPVYDVETFIRAIPSVLSRLPKTIFLIGGRGPQQEHLTRLMQELGVEQNVRFLGFVPNHNLSAYLRCATVYVSTSLSDAGIASSTAEAMACGTPVVITDSGENALWIKEGENGFLIPARDVDRLADRVVTLLEHEELRDQFSRNGRAIILERDDYRGEMEKMNSLYRRQVSSLFS